MKQDTLRSRAGFREQRAHHGVALPALRPQHWCLALPPHQPSTPAKHWQCSHGRSQIVPRGGLHAHANQLSAACVDASPLHEQPWCNPAASLDGTPPGLWQTGSRQSPHVPHASDQRVQCDDEHGKLGQFIRVWWRAVYCHAIRSAYSCQCRFVKVNANNPSSFDLTGWRISDAVPDHSGLRRLATRVHRRAWLRVLSIRRLAVWPGPAWFKREDGDGTACASWCRGRAC